MSEPLLRSRIWPSASAGSWPPTTCAWSARGELHAMIGPNGAGKTTLISQLSGQLTPDGRNFAGNDITGPPNTALHARPGAVVPDHLAVPRLSVLDNVALAVQAHDGHSFHFWRHARSEADCANPRRRSIASVLPTVPMASLLDLPRRAPSLELAMALAGKPRLLLLDEPMAGMGPEESQRMVELLSGLKGEMSILLVEHDMDAVFALADRISVLVFGRVIACDSPRASATTTEVRKAYLGEAEAEGSHRLRKAPDPLGRRHRDLLRPHPGAVRPQLTIALGEMCDADWPQRHGQDHHRARHHGAVAAARRASASLAAGDRGRPPYGRPARPGPGARGQADLSEPEGTQENLLVAAADARQAVAVVDAGRILRHVSAPGQPARLDGQPALGGRTADAGDRSRADDQPNAADSRRGNRRARATGARRDLDLPGGPEGHEGLSILVIDKNIRALMQVADRHFLIERGQGGVVGRVKRTRRRARRAAQVSGGLSLR